MICRSAPRSWSTHALHLFRSATTCQQFEGLPNLQPDLCPSPHHRSLATHDTAVPYHTLTKAEPHCRTSIGNLASLRPTTSEQNKDFGYCQIDRIQDRRQPDDLPDGRSCSGHSNTSASTLITGHPGATDRAFLRHPGATDRAFLGAAGWVTPVSALIDILRTAHTFTGAPWWSVIVLSGLSARLALLPLSVKSLKTSATLGPIISKAFGRDSYLPPETSFGKRYELFTHWRKQEGLPSPLWVPGSVIVHVAVFASVSFTIRRLATPGVAPIDMLTGGALWFPNLMQPALLQTPQGLEAPMGDAGLILPCVAAGLYMWNIKRAFRRYDENAVMRGVRTVLLNMGPVIAYAGLHAPSAVVLYWCSSFSFTAAQSMAMQQPVVRSVLGLPAAQSAASTSASLDAAPPEPPPPELSTGPMATEAASSESDLQVRGSSGHKHASSTAAGEGRMEAGPGAQEAGEAAGEQGLEHEETLAQLQQEVARDPHSFGAWMQLGELTANLAQWRAAGNYFQRAAYEAPEAADRARALLQLAVALDQGLGESEAAIAALREAATCLPDPPVKLFLADVLKRAGHLEEACEILAQVQAATKGGGEALQQEGGRAEGEPDWHQIATAQRVATEAAMNTTRSPAHTASDSEDLRGSKR